MVQVVPSFEVWILKAVAKAVSQFRSTAVRVCVAPRSTWSHCGSLGALDQRVVGSPSVAAAAGYIVLWMDEAVVGRPWESRVGPLEVGVPWTENPHSE